MQIAEIIGYIGSVLVAISLMMSGILKLRVINFVGAAVFSAYGFMVHALPVGLLNGFIALVDLYYLYDIFKAEEYFRILEVMHDSEYLRYFLDFHKADIAKYMPAFSFSPTGNTTVFFILRNSIPAGLIYAEKQSDESLLIKLDYVIPGYRDLKIGKYVYQIMFEKKHVGKIYSSPGNANHDNYLRKMGFEKIELNGKELFCLEVGK
jgi:hypothetical protein